MRAVAAGRGGKEGNNAFSADSQCYSQDGYDGGDLVEVLSGPRGRHVTKKFVQFLLTIMPDLSNTFFENLWRFLQNGNVEIAGLLIEQMVKSDGHGLNFLHKQSKFSHISLSLSLTLSLSLSLSFTNLFPRF